MSSDDESNPHDDMSAADHEDDEGSLDDEDNASGADGNTHGGGEDDQSHDAEDQSIAANKSVATEDNENDNSHVDDERSMAEDDDDDEDDNASKPPGDEEEKVETSSKADQASEAPKKKKKRKIVIPPGSRKGRAPAVKGLTIPFRTVKKAMKLDPDIPIVQNEAAIMTTLAAELFLKNLAKESHGIAKNRGRNTIRYEDVAEARTNDPSKSFLKTLLP